MKWTNFFVFLNFSLGYFSKAFIPIFWVKRLKIDSEARIYTEGIPVSLKIEQSLNIYFAILIRAKKIVHE